MHITKLKLSLTNMENPTETMVREKRLENNEWNVHYVAAYIKALQDIWESEFPEISSRADILGTLYNLGHERVPHSNPQATMFGIQTAIHYELMSVVLGE